MKNFEKHNFTKDLRHGVIGSFVDEASIRNDTNVEVSFSKLEEGFYAAPHIHTQSKTVVIILQGGIVFVIDGKKVAVNAGEYIVFAKGAVEEVLSVKPNTQNLTIHTPSIVGGDKKVV